MREREFIRHLLATESAPAASIELGPGDDMAVVRVGHERVLAAIDSVVEGRHFEAGTAPHLVARKAVLRNLSDVAAMAARPLACLAAVTLPRQADEALARDLLAGVRSAAEEHRCPLIGGDTTLHAGDGPLTISVAILATPALRDGRVLTRRGGRLGDLVAVTGELGNSLRAEGGRRHLDFPPRLEESVALGEALGSRLHAMIDVSDGLGVDAGHLVEHDSALAIELEPAAIPRRDGASLEQALADGEDFELLFLCEGPPPPMAVATPVTVIGRVVERGAGASVRWIGEPASALDSRGFEHRSKEGA